MTTIGRFSAALRTLSLFVVAELALTGCGDDAAGPQVGQTTPTASASTSAEPAAIDPISPDAQLVRVEKYGISFELPRGWMSLNAKNLLNSANPVIKEVANRMGTTPKQFAEMIGSSVQTFSVTDQGAVEGFLDNVNSVGMARANFNDDQLKLELAGLGARLGRFEHVSSPAGEVTRVPYAWTVSGVRVHVVVIVVDVGDAAASITVSSHSATEAEARANQVQASLKPLN